MSDNAPEKTDQERQYTETIVEYVDNRRQRIILSTLLVILFLLLLGASYAVFRLTPGKGAPASATATPRGITWVRSIYGWGNSPNQQLLAPTDVAIGADGTIWAVSGHKTIVGFNPDGTAHKVIQPKGTGSLEGISVGTDGNLYLADFAGQVVAFRPDGSLLDQWKVQLPNEVDMRDGKIAVVAANGLAEFTPDGEMLMQLGGQRGWGKDQFDLPHGVLIDPNNGDIYVSDTQNRRMKAISSTGRLRWTLGSAPDRSKPGAGDVRSGETSTSVFLLPTGLAMDGAGRLAVVDPFRFNITFVDAKTGKIAREPGSDGQQGRKAVYGEYGQSDGYFAYPTGIAYDKTRDWFAVADTYNNRIQIFRIPGSGGNALAPLIGGFTLPMCLFCLPLLLLLAAVVVLVVRRRREKAAAADATGGDPEAEEVVAPPDPESSNEG